MDALAAGPPGKPSDSVWASAFFQCHTLSAALNGNMATRHTRARSQAAPVIHAIARRSW